MELAIRCPVCGRPLICGEKTWHCGAGHSFDVARQGYVNLLTVSQKHSRNPGDTRDMVAARRAFLDQGFYAPVAETLCTILEEAIPPDGTVLDAGCGEGYYLSQVHSCLPEARLCGLDISRDAVRYAAVRCRDACWITGTAARLPFFDRSFDAVLSMFALTAAEEFARVLRPGGIFVQVLAGRAHLSGLKTLIYPTLTEKAPIVPAPYPGFSLQAARELTFPLELSSNAQVMQLLAMTPHFWRISREGAQRAAEAPSLRDEAQILFHIYRRESAEE